MSESTIGGCCCCCFCFSCDFQCTNCVSSKDPECIPVKGRSTSRARLEWDHSLYEINHIIYRPRIQSLQPWVRTTNGSWPSGALGVEQSKFLKGAKKNVSYFASLVCEIPQAPEWGRDVGGVRRRCASWARCGGGRTDVYGKRHCVVPPISIRSVVRPVRCWYIQIQLLGSRYRPNSIQFRYNHKINRLQEIVVPGGGPQLQREGTSVLALLRWNEEKQPESNFQFVHERVGTVMCIPENVVGWYTQPFKNLIDINAVKQLITYIAPPKLIS